MRTFTTLTQAPSAFMEPIHNRMPILLQPKPEQVWLDLDELPDHLWEAPAPSPSDLKKAYEVSTKVNSPRNNDPALEVPVSPHCALPHLDAKLDMARRQSRRRVTPSYGSTFSSHPPNRTCGFHRIRLSRVCTLR